MESLSIALLIYVIVLDVRLVFFQTCFNDPCHFRTATATPTHVWRDIWLFKNKLNLQERIDFLKFLFYNLNFHLFTLSKTQDTKFVITIECLQMSPFWIKIFYGVILKDSYCHLLYANWTDIFVRKIYKHSKNKL